MWSCYLDFWPICKRVDKTICEYLWVLAIARRQSDNILDSSTSEIWLGLQYPVKVHNITRHLGLSNRLHHPILATIHSPNNLLHRPVLRHLHFRNPFIHINKLNNKQNNRYNNKQLQFRYNRNNTYNIWSRSNIIWRYR